ncbi:MAG TPA: adenylyltransferase/cytidyltransferase family protein [Candidatus Peribacteraceae bacterium]|nr:adenylyltransferase/cytidyltransferase family protein [Candidatus Peribacteraceae bacterium]
MRILVSGTFDDLHPGHLFLLTEAGKRGDLWVIVARDRNVERIKGRPPLQSEKERKSAIEKAFPKAHVVLGDEWDFLQPVREIDPDLILLGYDQKLPPDVSLYDLPYKIERLPAFKPEVYKSSLRRKKEKE